MIIQFLLEVYQCLPWYIHFSEFQVADLCDEDGNAYSLVYPENSGKASRAELLETYRNA